MITEQDLIDAREHEDYAQEEDAGHADGLIAEVEAETDAEAAKAFPDEGEAFVPNTKDKVDWVLGRIADRRARAARIRENAEKIARQEEAEAESLIWRFGPALQAFCRAQTDGTKRKSLRLLNGVMGFRMKPAGVTIIDLPDGLAWAEANLPSCLRVDRRVLDAALTVNEGGDVVHKATGEKLDFAEAKPAEEVFFIR